MEDTIAILRGLKERYEIHHGVRIQDAALVAAALLSHRYISDRFLPDKAVDLMDEAASRLKIELESMPTEIDQGERAIMMLEMERQALRKEKDAASKERLDKLEKELSQVKEKTTTLKTRWLQEKEEIGKSQKLNEELEVLKNELAQAQRRGDFARASEIQYGRIPELSSKLEAHNERMAHKATTQHALLQEEVTEEDIGQEQAIKAVSSAVRRARAGLQEEDRPIGSFIFLGPTGVGKTELSKALAEFLFDDEHAMIRLDMSEYMEKHTVARLIGAPPGYVGYDEGGQLTEAVRRKPYSVILFDEVEKAHGDVFNVLLQVLDDGRITDGQGRTIDFKNCVIIMTSNIGSQFIMEDLKVQERNSRVMEALRGHFRPEFLNRIDEIVIFDRLSDRNITKIIDIQLSRLMHRLEKQKLSLQLSEKAKAYLAKEGYDPAYGARPLKRVIQQKILDPLSMSILDGHIKEGDALEGDFIKDELVFRKT